MKRPVLLVLLLLIDACHGFQQCAPSFAARGQRLQSTSTTTVELPEMNGLPSMETFNHDLNTPPQVDDDKIRDDINMTVDTNLPLAPPLTFNKYLSMQDKRVVATIRYTDGCGLKPYYLTAAKKIKASHPDVVIEKRILPGMAGEGSAGDVAFEILVDDKIVVGNQARSRKQRGVGDSGDGSVYISMQEMDLAISKARRKRRPSTLYGEDGSPENRVRLEMLRKSREEESETDRKSNKWND